MSFYLIETNEQLKNFHLGGYEDIFIEIIPYSYKEHPSQNEISLIYIRPWQAPKGYIVAISHSESLVCDISHVSRVILGIKTVYVKDRKEFLNYFPLPNVIDLTMDFPDFKIEYTKAHKWLSQKYPDKKDINRIIPIVKHYEYCEKLFDLLQSQKNKEFNGFLNNTASIVFSAIERNGIKVDKEKFEKSFHPIDSDYVYTQYNFKTVTTRPSNSFKGVNYAALNKKNKDRECFIPRNDTFIELDISGYHPTLLGKLINYKFDNGGVHESFAKMYGTNYEQAKKITFKQMYGEIFEEYKDLEFFKGMTKFIDELWDKFQTEGYIECPISKHRFYRDKLDNMNPQKLLSYHLQRLETSLNVLMLWDILKLMVGKKSVLVLYVYDSILIDYNESEKELLEDIKNVFTKNKLKIKTTRGLSYGEMVI